MLPLGFSPARITTLLARGRSEELCELWLDTLDRIARLPPVLPSPEVRATSTIIIQSLCFCFCQADFRIPDNLLTRFINHNSLVADLAAASAFGTTDFAVEQMANRPDQLAKLLVLYSTRNRTKLDLVPACVLLPVAVSHWYIACCTDASYHVDSEAFRRFREHLEEIDRFDLVADGQHLNAPYFIATYVDATVERKVKGYINGMVRRAVGDTYLMNPAAVDPRHVVVLSGAWRHKHSVHRTNYNFVAALKDHYRLTFVKLAGISAPEEDLFDDVVDLSGDIGRLRGLGAQVAFFPDVGMLFDSVVVCNLRIAPIQIMGFGHPVSTFGSEIDYCLSGREIEDNRTAAAHYSERLILLPGRGVAAKPIPGLRPMSSPSGDLVRVALPWSPAKFNPRMLALMREVADQAKRPVRYQIILRQGLDSMGMCSFISGLREALGSDRIDITAKWLDQPAYMEWLGGAHVSADSHPFAGFNTIVDALFVGIPPVAFEGDRSFSRFGPHLLRKLKLTELVAGSVDSYAKLLLRLIDDEGWREDMQARVRAIPLDRIFEHDDGSGFRKAVDRLIACHDTLSGKASRDPIVID